MHVSVYNKLKKELEEKINFYQEKLDALDTLMKPAERPVVRRKRRQGAKPGPKPKHVAKRAKSTKKAPQDKVEETKE